MAAKLDRSLTLTVGEIDRLRNCIAEAEAWRGAIVGNPDPEALTEFDSNILKAKQALLKVVILNNAVRAKYPAKRKVANVRKENTHQPQ